MTDHPLSCAYQIGRTKENQNHYIRKKEKNFTKNEKMFLARKAGKENIDKAEIILKMKELLKTKCTSFYKQAVSFCHA